MHRSSSGFSLIEAAIVLGIVGLVIGGIWVAAAAVNQSNNLARAKEYIALGLTAYVQARDSKKSLTGISSHTTLPTAQVGKALGILPLDCVITSDGSGGYYCQTSGRFRVTYEISSGWMRFGIMTSSMKPMSSAECIALSKAFVDAYNKLKLTIEPTGDSGLRYITVPGAVLGTLTLNGNYTVYNETNLQTQCSAAPGSGLGRITLTDVM